MVSLFNELLPSLQAEAVQLDQNVRRPAAEEQTAQGQPATGLAPELSKKNVFEDIALAHREIYALYEIAQAMGTSLGVSDTMALISSKLSNLVPFSCAALFLYDEETETLRCRFATGTDADIIQQVAVHSGEGLTGWVARNRRPLVNARPSADLEAAGLTHLSTTLQSALVCPLMFNERFIGTLSVYHTDAAFYRDDHRRLLDRVSEQAAAVINNSMVFEQTQEDSLTDPLTGLPNTRFMFMHLTRELARAERLKAEVSLLVMDLDNFKEINDNHGHHVGDRALCEVARVLRAAIRPYDICVRYAGDEFIVVLSGCGADEAEHKRQELQKSIDEVYFEARPGKRLTLGISVGAAVFPQDGESYEALLATADSRMYQDKSGRKRRTGRENYSHVRPACSPATRRTPSSATSTFSAPRREFSSLSQAAVPRRRFAAPVGSTSSPVPVRTRSRGRPSDTSAAGSSATIAGGPHTKASVLGVTRSDRCAAPVRPRACVQSSASPVSVSVSARRPSPARPRSSSRYANSSGVRAE